MILESILAGGATGVLGSLFTNIAEIFKARQNQKFELERRRLDLEAMDKEFDSAERRAEIAAAQASDTADADLMARSYAADAATYSVGRNISSPWAVAALVFVDVVRGLVRPVVTGIMMWMLWETREEVRAIVMATGMPLIDAAKAGAIYGSIVDAVIYIATAATLWWFGTRMKKGAGK